MMRSMPTHQYVPARYAPQVHQGTIKVVSVKGVQNTWAISRPVSAPTPSYNPPASILHGSGVGFSPSKPNVEMDPSNQQTWQRQYRFSN